MSSQTIIAQPEARVSTEQHARAVLVRLLGAHRLPVAPDGIQWRQAPTSATLVIAVAARADVDLWAAVIGVDARNDDLICDSTTEPGVWLVDRLRYAARSGWLPGVTLRVQWRELRHAAPKEATR